MSFLSDRVAKNGPELYALFTGGLPAFVTARHPQPLDQAIPVFCYHVVTHEAFERDMQFLAANHYTTVAADELLGWMQRKNTLPPNTVTLTFDDGADNFHRIAFPLLMQYHQKAILFIAPGLHRTAAEEPYQTQRPCTWEELDEMHASGLVDIQSHTWEHRSLQHWPTPLPLTGITAEHIHERRQEPLDMQADILLARQTLEQRFSKPIHHLAWPCYYSDPEAIEIARNNGYTGLWTGTLPRLPLITPGHDPHQIVRLSGEFLRRLPGSQRESLYSVLKTRYKRALPNLRRGKKTP